MSLADVSTNKHLPSKKLCMQTCYTSLRTYGLVVNNVPLERWIQLIIGDFKTVNLARANETAVIGYTRIFVYQRARCYKGRMNAGPDHRYVLERKSFFSDLKKILYRSIEEKTNNKHTLNSNIA